MLYYESLYFSFQNLIGALDLLPLLLTQKNQMQTQQESKIVFFAEKKTEADQNILDKVKNNHSINGSNFRFHSNEIQKRKRFLESIEKWELFSIDYFQRERIENNNRACSLFKSVKNIKFTNLTLINISNHNVYTMEGICRMDIPKIKMIYLCITKINTMKELRKCYFPFLNILSIYDNAFVEEGKLPEMHLKDRFLLGNLAIELEHGSLLQMNSLSWVAKLKTNNTSPLHFQSEKRINENAVRKALSKKNKQK